VLHEEERAIVRFAHDRWGESDLQAFLGCLTDDIVYTVNVDARTVPYAMSTVGKDDMRGHLQLLLDTFVINAFVIESLVHDDEFSRTTVLGYYKHKKTGERLDIRIRFRLWVRDGLIARLEEYHDAPYVEAFERFVGFLQQNASEATDAGSSAPAT
jgi:ketosteroid isomerase-like protein